MRTSYSATGIQAEVMPELACSASAPALYEADIVCLAGVIREAAPDLVLASTVDAFAAIDATWLSGLPSIWNIREGEPWRSRLADRHAAVAARALACFSYPQAVIFVTKSSKTCWSQFVRPDRARVIYNAPPPGLRRPPDEELAKYRLAAGASKGDFLLASVGTLCERKGQIDVALALELLPTDIRSRVRVAFVGRSEGYYAERVRKALSPDTAARTTFIGDSANGPAWIAAADALINTSRSEAFPRTFIEAAVMRTPMIAAAVDGVTERLSPGRSALLFPVGDLQALANAIGRLATEPETVGQLVQAAAEDLAESWAWSDMTNAYVAEAASAIARNRN